MRVVDGAGRARGGRVEQVDRSSARILLEEWAPSLEEPLEVEIVFVPPRGERASWFVEKATELGAVRLTLLRSERAVPGRDTTELRQRLDRVTRAALAQCGRSRLPELAGPVRLGDWLDRLPQDRGTSVALDPAGQPGFERRSRLEGPVRMLVGPEGGWSDSERSQFERRDVAMWSLGTRPLRIETAALVALARLFGRVPI